MTEDIDEMLREIESAQSAVREPEHPQYIEGTLYLTPKQIDQILIETPPNELYPWTRRASTGWAGISVVQLYPGFTTRLPSGRVLVYSRIHEDALFIIEPPEFNWTRVA